MFTLIHILPSPTASRLDREPRLYTEQGGPSADEEDYGPDAEGPGEAEVFKGGGEDEGEDEAAHAGAGEDEAGSEGATFDKPLGDPEHVGG